MLTRIKKIIYDKTGICLHVWGRNKSRRYFKEWQLNWKVCTMCKKVKKKKHKLSAVIGRSKF